MSRLFNIAYPSNYVFDEQYHVSAAKLSLHNDSRFFEWWHPPTSENVYFDWLHPPIMKYLQAFFMLMFGEQAFAWRLPSVIFGVALIISVYFLGKELFKSHYFATVAMALVSLDGLILVQSRIGMNDIVVSFFLVLLFYFYLVYRRKKKHSSLLKIGLIAGLGIATKWSAFFGLVAVFIFLAYEIVSKKKWQQLPWLIFCLVLLPAVIYLLSFWQMFSQGKNLTHFFELHRQIIWYQIHRPADHLQASKPWQWFTNTAIVTYWRDQQNQGDFLPGIFAFGNPIIQLMLSLSVMTVIFTIIRVIVNKKFFSSSILLLLIFYLMVWLPWIFSPRIMFYYHYTPAIALGCLILVYQLQVWQKKLNFNLINFVLLASFLGFLVFFPIWAGIASSQDLVNTVYSALFTDKIIL